MNADSIENKDAVAAQLTIAATQLLPQKFASHLVAGTSAEERAAIQALAIFGWIRERLSQGTELPQFSHSR